MFKIGISLSVAGIMRQVVEGILCHKAGFVRNAAVSHYLMRIVFYLLNDLD